MAVSATQWWSWYQLSESQQYIEGVAETGWVEDEAAWARHYEALQTVELVAPLGAVVRWRLGELERWRAVGLRLWPERRREVMETAQNHYLRGVARAPSDGALIAEVAHRLVTTDESLALVLMRRALDVAPFEPTAQYNSAAVGLRLFEELEGPMQESFNRTLAHALKNRKLDRAIEKLALQHGREDWLSQFDNTSGN